MEKARAIYEFIEDYARTACSAIILLEGYTMTDAEDDYRQLIKTFDIYMEYYEDMSKGIRDGRFSEEAADVCLRTYLNWLREKSSKNFKNKIMECLDPDIRIEVEKKVSKIDFSSFNTTKIQKILKNIRKREELIGE